MSHQRCCAQAAGVPNLRQTQFCSAAGCITSPNKELQCTADICPGTQTVRATHEQSLAGRPVLPAGIQQLRQLCSQEHEREEVQADPFWTKVLGAAPLHEKQPCWQGPQFCWLASKPQTVQYKAKHTKQRGENAKCQPCWC